MHRENAILSKNGHTPKRIKPECSIDDHFSILLLTVDESSLDSLNFKEERYFMCEVDVILLHQKFLSFLSCAPEISSPFLWELFCCQRSFNYESLRFLAPSIFCVTLSLLNSIILVRRLIRLSGKNPPELFIARPIEKSSLFIPRTFVFINGRLINWLPDYGLGGIVRKL